MPWLRVPYSTRYLDGQYGRGLRVCLSGFKSVERRRLVELLELVAAQRGAVVADGFDRECSLLVAAGMSEKVNKAREWSIPVVSAHWVVESLKRAFFAYNVCVDQREASYHERYVLSRGHTGRQLTRRNSITRQTNVKNKLQATAGFSVEDVEPCFQTLEASSIFVKGCVG